MKNKKLFAVLLMLLLWKANVSIALAATNAGSVVNSSQVKVNNTNSEDANDSSGGDPSVDDEIITNPDDTQMQAAQNDVAAPEGNQDEQITQASNESTNVSAEQKVIMQISTLTQAQGDLQAKIEKELNEPEKQSSFFVRFYGPDFGNLKKIRSDIAEEMQETQNFEQMVNQMPVSVSKGVLNGQLKTLKAKDAQYVQKFQARENMPSFLGWLVKLFYRY